MSKSGYEIRSEILALAQDRLMQQWHFTCHAIREKRESTKQVMGDGTVYYSEEYPEFPAAPSATDVIKEAAILYNFVDSM